MLEMCEWEIIWTRGNEEAWKRWGGFWRERLESEGRSPREIKVFLDNRVQMIATHPVVKFVDTVNHIFWKYKPFRWHWQDLNDGKRHWLYGRGWFNPLPNIKGEDATTPTVRVEWCIPGSLIGISIDAGGDDDDLVVGIGCGLSLYVGLEGFIPRKWLPREERTISVQFHHGILWFAIWRDEMGWRGDRYKWQEFNIDFAELLLGRMVYSESERITHRAELYLPEATYQAGILQYQATWKRSRWIARTVTRFEIIPSKPIPIPGKGENPWDCDEDAVYTSTLTAGSAEEAVQNFIDGIHETRKRYGGDRWVPEAMQV